VKLKWQKCTSVMTGGKHFFWFAYSMLGSRMHVVWDRVDKKWHCQQDDETIAKFDSDKKGLAFFNKES